MKTAFIIPSWHCWSDPLKQQPLTELYLATIIEEQTDAEVDLIDLRGDLNKEIPERDIYFYSIMSPDFIEVVDISKKLRIKYPSSKHIAGGIHTSCEPLESLKYFDSVVIGKGEEVIKNIIKSFPKLREVYFKEANGIYPFPKRHFLPKERVVSSLFKSEEIDSTTAIFSNGCPYQCGFCANYNQRKIEREPLTKIVKEIDYLKSEYNIKGISMVDSVCIPSNESYSEEYFNELKKMDIKWRGQTRAGISKRLLKLARESGCLELSFGVESASKDVLKYVNKRIDLDTIKDTIKFSKEAGIKTQITLINGLPKEPENIVELTKSFIKEVNSDYTFLCSLVVYPKSPFFDNPKKYGIESIDTNYENYQVLIHRFKDTEKDRENDLNFKYSNGFSKKRILNNLFELQDFLINGGYNE